MTHLGRLPGRNEALWEWQLRAACRGMETSSFFHPWNDRGVSRHEREAQAKQVCAGCPVLAECRSHALSVQEAYGVWGGMTENERDALLHRSSRGRAVDSVST
jgi:WhiB family redox-sensing transcriptional regulator